MIKTSIKSTGKLFRIKETISLVLLAGIIPVIMGFVSPGTFLYDLTVNYVENPIGIERADIIFSWKMKSSIVGQSQTEYQITVSDPYGTEIWNSGTVASGISVGIPYGGPVLQMETRYTWTVKVKCSNGESVNSVPAFFETGTDFKDAEWISYKSPAESCFNKSYRISMTPSVLQGGFTLLFGIKNDNNCFEWNFTDRLLISGKVNTNGTIWLDTVNLDGIIQLNIPFDLEVEVTEKTLTTSINGKPVSHIDNKYSIELPYIGLRVAPAQVDRRTRELRRPAQAAMFTDVMINVDGYTENIGEKTFILSVPENAPTQNQGSFQPAPVAGTSFMQVTYQGRPVKYIPESTLMPIFRTEKVLKGKVESARLYISSLGIYDAYINGREVMMKTGDGKEMDDAFSPGWTNYNDYIYYRTYDVTDYIDGANVALGAKVGNGWYAGIIGRQYYGEIGDDNVNELALLAKLIIKYKDGSSDVIVTNTSDWKVSDKGPVLLNDFFQGEIYDSRLEAGIADWNRWGFDDAGWKYVTRLHYSPKLIGGNSNTAYLLNDDRVYPADGDETYIYDPSNINFSTGLKWGEIVREPVSPLKEISLEKGKRLIVDLGQNIAGLTNISFSGKEGTRVQMRGAEMLNDGKENQEQTNAGSCGPGGTLYWYGLTRGRASDENWYTDTYIMNNKPVQDYRASFTFHGFRYFEIWADDDIIIHTIYGQPVTSAVKQTGNIVTNNENVNKLFRNTLWSQKGNYLSIPTDCPNRSERLGWSGDVNVFSETAMFNFDVAGFLDNYMMISENFAENNGGYFGTTMPGESSGAGRSNAGWTDVAIILAWNLYLQTGDKAVLEKYHNMLVEYMSLIMKNGLTAGYGDWVAFQATSPAYMAVMYQAYDALLMSKIAAVLGHNNDTAVYYAEYKRLIEEIRAKYVDNAGNVLSVTADKVTRGGFLSPDIILDNSQTSILWALKMDLYRSYQEQNTFLINLVENIENKGSKARPNAAEKTLSTGFLGVNVLLPVLTSFGLTNTAYDLLLQDGMPSWLYEVKLGATTTWERWNAYSVENSFADYGMNSFNHYAYGAVVEWMYENMAGIQKDESNPGFRNVILQPSIDNGTQYNSQPRISTVTGSYESYYGTIISEWKAGNGLLTSYEADIPANTTATLYLPESSYTEKSLKKIKIPGVTFMEISEHNGTKVAKFQLLSGGYKFEIKKGKLVASLKPGYLKK